MDRDSSNFQRIDTSPNAVGVSSNRIIASTIPLNVRSMIFTSLQKGSNCCIIKDGTLACHS